MALTAPIAILFILAGGVPRDLPVSSGAAVRDTTACAPDTVVGRPHTLSTGDAVRVLQTVVFTRSGASVGTVTVEYLTGRPAVDTDGLRVEAAAVADVVSADVNAVGIRPTVAVVRACHPGVEPPSTALVRQFRLHPRPDGGWTTVPQR